jgi:hypothetical protein
MRRLVLALVVAGLILAGCNPAPAQTPTPASDLVGTMVAQTLAAVPSLTPSLATQEPPTATIAVLASPTPGTGEVGGRVCYPSGASAMTAYFEESSSHQVTELPLADRQPTYKVTLPPGTYLAYAWLDDFSQGGSYSQCGTDDSCTDARPLAFPVLAGQALTTIDLCDWSHGPFDIPYPPGHSIESATGIISGSIRNYPNGDLPSLTVVAFNQGNGYWYWVGTVAGQTFYSIADLPPGTYQVVAYDSHDRAGGSPLATVTAGETTTANVTDWNGAYPDNPAR